MTKENADFSDVGYVKQRHLDAFCMMLDRVRAKNLRMTPTKTKLGRHARSVRPGEMPPGGHRVRGHHAVPSLQQLGLPFLLGEHLLRFGQSD